ncbi:MAG: hypothetical protein WBB45_16610 [Cyclobacteriaceae bacterium]
MKAKKLSLKKLTVESFRTLRRESRYVRGGMDCTDTCVLDTGCYTCFLKQCGG